MYNIAQSMFYIHVSVDCFCIWVFLDQDQYGGVGALPISYHENLRLLNSAASSIGCS